MLDLRGLIPHQYACAVLGCICILFMLWPLKVNTQGVPTFPSVFSFSQFVSSVVFDERSSTLDAIEGIVYYDADIDGEKDEDDDGVPNVTVELFDDSIVIATQQTGAQGEFSFTGLNQNQVYQVSISNIPAGWAQSYIGPDNQGEIIQITTIEDPVSFGIYDASGHCEMNPILITPCYVEGEIGPSINGEAAVVSVLADAEGHHFNGVDYSAEYEASSVATYGQVGTVYGIAYQAKSRNYYAAAFHKRYTDYGPGGADAIYQLDLQGNIVGTINLDNVINATQSTGGNVHDLSTTNDGVIYDLGTNDVSFDAPGKRGFGDIEISDDGNTLYAVNLWDKKVYALDISTGDPLLVSLDNAWNTPDATNSGTHRPFGMAYHNNQLWIGSVDEDSLQAYVHSMNLSNGDSFLELVIPLNYPRQAFFGNADNAAAPGVWNTWANASTLNYFNPSSEIAYPQAMLTDIEFTQDGTMILGFRDRFGDQVGAGKRFRPSDGGLTWGIAQGDILKACFVGGNYILETGTGGACSGPGALTNSGPGGSEFYYWDMYEFETNNWNPSSNTGGFHWETAQGGLVQLDSQEYIITTALDPFNDFSGGFLKLNNNTGRREGVTTTAVPNAQLKGGYTIFEVGDFQGGFPAPNGYAGKANGLGDIEAACVLDITIGNYVWRDQNNNGLQDPNESGLAGLDIALYLDNILQGTATTDANGHYYFGGYQRLNLNPGILVQPNTAYEIRLNVPTTFNITEVTLSDVAGDASDARDSDAIEIDGQAIISYTTQEWGFNDYSLDIGFAECEVVTTTFVNEDCSGSGYVTNVNGTIYNETNPVGSESLIATSGCDSIVDIQLIFYAPDDTIINYQGIVGDGYSLTVGPNTYTEANPIGSTILTNQYNCDSTVNVRLTFLPDIPLKATCTTLIQDDFESGYGNWNDGGNDCTRVNNAARASSGNISVRLRDNSNTSYMTTDNLMLADADTVKVSFHFFPFSFESGEDFWLQVSTNGGGSYTIVRAWVVGADFTNNVAQDVTVSIPGPFTNSTRLRLRCDASGNGDQVYIDDVIIEACEAQPPADCPMVNIPDVTNCAQEVILIDGNPSGGVLPYIGHLWTDLGTGSSDGYNITQQTSQTVSLDLTDATGGDIRLSYRVIGQDGCAVTDTMSIFVSSDPLCVIEASVDTTCQGLEVELNTQSEYLVTPMAGFVPAGNTDGVTVQHEIIGVKDPNSTKVTITIPTWDDHFDSILLNGNMIIPEVFEPDSWNANGMNCTTPWFPNINGLPRSVITIEEGAVRYYSSLTTTSTELTEVFPISWPTTLQSFREGDNTLQFGVLNTAGPVSGSWSIVAESNIGYDYLWSTGETSQDIVVLPDMTTTYTVTVTSANGCQSVCEKSIVVSDISAQVDDVLICIDDTTQVMGIVTSLSEIQSHNWTVIGLDNNLVLSDVNSDILTVDASAATASVTSVAYSVINQEGCESIDTFLIRVFEPSYTTVDYEMCEGDTIVIEGQTIVSSGLFESRFSTLVCDSIVSYNVQFYPSYSGQELYTGCAGDGYEVTINGTIYNESNPFGQEVMTTAFGCDSIINVNLEFNPVFNEVRSYTGCSDDDYSLIVNGTTYDVNNSSGVESMQTVAGCDSIITIDFQFAPAVIVEAGLVPEVVCSNSAVDLTIIGASITGGTTSGTWTSVGGGVFDGGGQFGIAESYQPSNAEIEAGEIILTLTSEDPPGSCEPEADAVMILINDLRCSQFPWVGN